MGQRTKTPVEPSGIGPAFNSGVPTDFDILGMKMDRYSMLTIRPKNLEILVESQMKQLFFRKSRGNPPSLGREWQKL